MAGVLFSAVVLLMSVWSAGRGSWAGWPRACRACWEPARAHLKPPFPFGSRALILSWFPFPAPALRNEQTVPWQLEAEDFEGNIFLVTMRVVNLFYLPTSITYSQDLMDARHVATCSAP